jgi:hypothetical protein
MGYRTKYTLKLQHVLLAEEPPIVIVLPETASQIVMARLKAGCDDADDALNMNGSSTGNEASWYEHEKDMRAFSKQHPSILFILSGDGEQSGDIWTKYFLNGKVQVAKAVLNTEPFNISKLT